MSAIGGCAMTETDPLALFTEAIGDAIPSWAAEVGILMNGRFCLFDAIFATSMLFPPPTAITIVDFDSHAACST
jgi:hypothetical protein